MIKPHPYKFRLWNDFTKKFVLVSYKISSKEHRIIKQIQKQINVKTIPTSIWLSNNFRNDRTFIQIPLSLGYSLNDVLYFIIQLRLKLDPKANYENVKDNKIKPYYLTSTFVRDSINWIETKNIFDKIKSLIDYKNTDNFWVDYEKEENKEIDAYKKEFTPYQKKQLKKQFKDSIKIIDNMSKKKK